MVQVKSVAEPLSLACYAKYGESKSGDASTCCQDEGAEVLDTRASTGTPDSRAELGSHMYQEFSKLKCCIEWYRLV